MGKRISVTERVLEDRPPGRGFEAFLDEMQNGNSTGRRDEKATRDAEVQSDCPRSSKLIKATFLLDPESLDILDRIWLRQRKRGGQNKSALVREAIRWFRAKPGNRVEQILEAISSVVNRAAVKGRGATKHTIAVIVTVVLTVVGSVFIGGALWLAQGGHRGAGDAMGVGILTSLGATLILLGLGTALISAVTYFAGLSVEAEDAGAPQEEVVEASSEAPETARSKRMSRPRWRLREKA
jgi:hypothetical protein